LLRNTNELTSGEANKKEMQVWKLKCFLKLLACELVKKKKTWFKDSRSLFRFKVNFGGIIEGGR